MYEQNIYCCSDKSHVNIFKQYNIHWQRIKNNKSKDRCTYHPQSEINIMSFNE